MPVISSFPQGTFCWIELATSDRDAAKDFYTKIFGWTTSEVPMEPGNPYVLLQKNGTNAAALYKRRDDNIPPNWATYVAVDNTDASAEKVKSLGGSIMAGPFDVMDMGRMAFAADPQGASFALWQPLKPGDFIVGETGTLCWNELMTKDTAAAEKFYTSLFGWTAKGGSDYTEWHLDGRGIGGMIDKIPDGAPPNWVPYFQVDDTDAIVDEVKFLGGSVYMPATDFPHVGRFALLADPQGATFYVIKLQLRH
jgi:predicted enzyme related to lactoylglutathione lyase